MTLSAMEFLRRFVQHILPRGFVRIRQSGFLANTCRVARLTLARMLLATPSGGGNPDARDRDVDHRGSALCHVAMSPMRHGDDRRSDRFGAPPRDAHPRFRHLMSVTRPRRDRRPCRRDRPRVGDRVSVVISRSTDRERQLRTRPASPTGRHRSRGAALSIRTRPSRQIPLPAP